jgi:hypothetical protein
VVEGWAGCYRVWWGAYKNIDAQAVLCSIPHTTMSSQSSVKAQTQHTAHPFQVGVGRSHALIIK